MGREIFQRLDALEKVYTKNPIMVLCKTESGEMIMSVAECVRCDADFLRVVSGGDISDLDILLPSMRKKAWKEVENSRIE